MSGLGLAPEPVGGRRQLLDEVADGVADARQRTTFVGDDLGVDAMACRPPLVLTYDPAPRHGERVPAVIERVQPFHKRLADGGHRRDLAHGRHAVADAELDGAEVGMRTNVPPHLADGADGLG